MVADMLVRYGHFLALIGLSGTIIMQNVLLADEMSLNCIRKMGKAKWIRLVSIAVIFITGMLLWIAVGKPKEMYSPNAFLHVKMTVFFIVAGMSFYISGYFKKQVEGAGGDAIRPSSGIKIMVRLQLVLFLLLPLFATFLSHGFGRRSTAPEVSVPAVSSSQAVIAEPKTVEMSKK